MKRILTFLLFLCLVTPLCADEPQVDHTYGLSPLVYNGVKLSPDGKRLAVAGSDGVKVYESRTGKVLGTYAANGFATTSLAWSDDGKTLAAGGLTFDSKPRGEIALLREGAAPLRWKTGDARIYDLQFLPQSRGLCSLSASVLYMDDASGALQIWDSYTGALKRTLATFKAATGNLAVSGDKKNIICLHSDIKQQNVVEKFDLVTGKRLSQRKLKYGEVENPVDFSIVEKRGDQSLGLECVKSYDQSVAVFLRLRDQKSKVIGQQKIGSVGSSFDMRSGIVSMTYSLVDKTNVIETFQVETKPVHLKKLASFGLRTVAPAEIFGNRAPLNKWNAAVYLQNGFRSFDGNLKVIKSETFPKNTVVGLPSSSFASPDSKTWFYESKISLKRGEYKPLEIPEAQAKDKNKRALSVISDVAWRSDSKLFVVLNGSRYVSGMANEGIFVFDGTGKLIRTLKSPNTQEDFVPYNLTMSSDDKRLIVVGGIRKKDNENTFRIEEWDVDTGRRMRAIDGRTDADLRLGGEISSIKYSPDGKQFAIGGMMVDKGIIGARVTIWSDKDFKKVGSLPLQKEWHSMYWIGAILTRRGTWDWSGNNEIVMLKNGYIERWDVARRTLLKRALIK